MGDWGGILIATGAVISITGTLNAIVLGGSRLPFALSKENQFPGIFSFVHPKRLTPTWSLLGFIGITIIVSVAWSFLSALTIGSIIRVMVYLMVSISMIRLRLKRNGEENYYKVRYGYFLAIAAIGFAIWLLLSSKGKELRDVAIAVAIGIFMYVIVELFRMKRIKKADIENEPELPPVI